MLLSVKRYIYYSYKGIIGTGQLLDLKGKLLVVFLRWWGFFVSFCG
jgi:hypothetical protein